VGEEVKAGAQVLDEFFASLAQIPDVDAGIARELSELFRSGSLSKDTILSALAKLRQAHVGEGGADAGSAEG